MGVRRTASHTGTTISGARYVMGEASRSAGDQRPRFPRSLGHECWPFGGRVWAPLQMGNQRYRGESLLPPGTRLAPTPRRRQIQANGLAAPSVRRVHPAVGLTRFSHCPVVCQPLNRGKYRTFHVSQRLFALVGDRSVHSSSPDRSYIIYTP
jgi:hypothetical protein